MFTGIIHREGVTGWRGVAPASGAAFVARSPDFMRGTALSMASAGGCAPSVPPGAFISGVALSIVFVGASSPGFVGAGVAAAWGHGPPTSWAQVLPSLVLWSPKDRSWCSKGRQISSRAPPYPCSSGGCAPSVPPRAFISGVAASIDLVGASSPGFVGAGVAVWRHAGLPRVGDGGRITSAVHARRLSARSCQADHRSLRAIYAAPPSPRLVCITDAVFTEVAADKPE